MSSPTSAAASATEVFEHVQQVRAAHQRLADLARDTDAQAARYLVSNPFAQHSDCLRSLLQLYYPFSDQLLTNHAARLDRHLLAQNIHLTNAAAGSQVPDLTLDWTAISRYYPLTPSLLKRFSAEIDWDEAARNPLIDWSENLIHQHGISSSEFFANLSANPGPNWTTGLLVTFQDKWDGTYAGLLNNENLPWEDDETISVVRKVIETQSIYYDEAYSARNRMEAREWKRRSLNRHTEWTTDYVRENADELQWAQLSANPALPFTLELLVEFADRWQWDELAANHGLYEKALRPWLNEALVHEVLVLTA
ncbi:MAG: hypothetical protein ACRYG7_09065 [Janthinobacterium lividum]